MENEILIDMENVTIYAVENEQRRYYKNNIILANVNLQLFAGEIVYLIGKVGSGKSSLLKTLYAELPLVSGWARVNDFDLTTLKDRDVPTLRRSLGLVFQDFQLLPDRSVYENLRFFLRSIGWKNIAAINERIDETLKMVSLRDKAQKLPYELSGGEQQRLAIGRALLNRPRIILADEPTGNLDPMCTTDIMQIFSDVASMGCAVIIATHNLSIIEQFPSRTLLLTDQTVSDIDINTQ